MSNHWKRTLLHREYIDLPPVGHVIEKMAGCLETKYKVPAMNVVIFLLLFIFSTYEVVECYDYPFQNPSLSWDERVNDLVGRLTLGEITQQMAKGGAGQFGGPAPAIPRLGIGPYSWNTECLRGDVQAGDATSFPQAIGLAASFSRQLVFDVAEATSVEVRGKYLNYVANKQYGDHKGLSCFSPVINIVRDPRWGRNQETYGEDPYLSGALAESFVQGMQGDHPRYIRANAGCKHFAAYAGPENIPTSRLSFNAKVSERDLRTTFLPAFRSCVKAGSYSLMCSYNSVNGIPACANGYLMNDILRGQWNFKGYVVSDEGAIENMIAFHHYKLTHVDTAAACINAGCNLELSGNDLFAVYLSMVEAIKQKKLNESTVRESVKPLFFTRMRLGEFDPPSMNPYSQINMSSIQGDAHRQLSLDAALKSFVLLKNSDSFLPIRDSNISSIAVIGPMADNIEQLFGDYSADLMKKYVTLPLTGLKEFSKKVNFVPGCKDNRCLIYTDKEKIKQAVSGVKVTFVCVGTGQEIESEGRDRRDINLPGHQMDILKDAVTYSSGPVVLLVFSAGPVNISWAVQSPKVSAILQCFFPAQTAGTAIFNVLTARGPFSIPAGRLPYTWPKYASQIGDMTDYSMKGRTYRYMDSEPLFQFGFGLSYNSYNYTNLKYPSVVNAGQNLSGTVWVESFGKYDGEEVVEVYISWENATVPTPRLQLVDFHRVSINQGLTIQVSFSVSAESMAVWVDNKGWVVEPGTMDLYVGGQQPSKSASNVLHGQFKIVNSVFLGVY